MKRLKLSPDEQRILHNEITGQGLDGYKEILALAKEFLEGNSMKSALSDAITAIIGSSLSRKYLGKGTGNRVSLDYEDDFGNCFSFYITCSWRLRKYGQILCSSTNSNEIGGSMLTGFSELEEAVLKDFVLDPITYDLKLIHCNDLVLDIFCDENNLDDEWDNYSVFHPNKYWTVTGAIDVKEHLRTTTSPHK